ncbi:MAG: metal dependent phosphohydrolase [Bryobacterales bacterium]|nr:metal dependent phosphohydrolase [Bryobacterales bacterium]
METEPRAVLANQIILTLRERGHQAYLVGGCVRDRLLGIIPKDYDVSTDATPDLLLGYFPRSQPVGAHFGVVLVTCEAGFHVEVATFRSEGAYVDGRRPDKVHFETDPALDAKRRDFTINGLMQDPLSMRVLDFVGGQEDLEARTIRAIGDAAVRYAEDHLRMLRAIRFAARLHFSIEERTMSAIRELAPAITRISTERIRDELIRILTEGGAKRGFELLDESGLLKVLLPEIKAFQGVEQPPEFHPEGDVWTHVLLMLDNLHSPTPSLAAGVLLHDVGKPPTYRVADRIRFDGHAEVGAEMTRSILHRLRFSNQDLEQITSLVANHMRFKDVMQMRTSTLKRFLCMPHFEEHLELHRLDCQASNGYTAAYDFVKAKQAEFGEEQLRPPRLLTGKDLIAEGYKPGPAFSVALSALETAQLEGQITTREEALEIVRAVLDPLHLPH